MEGWLVSGAVKSPVGLYYLGQCSTACDWNQSVDTKKKVRWQAEYFETLGHKQDSAPKLVLKSNDWIQSCTCRNN